MSDFTPEQSGSGPPPPPPLTTSQYGVPGYGASPYPVAPVDAPSGLASLILGILGLMGVPFCSLIAMILGFSGRIRVKQAPPGTYNTGMLTAGWVMGIIGTVLWVLALFLFILVIALFAGSSGPEPGALVPFL